MWFNVKTMQPEQNQNNEGTVTNTPAVTPEVTPEVEPVVTPAGDVVTEATPTMDGGTKKRNGLIAAAIIVVLCAVAAASFYFYKMNANDTSDMVGGVSYPDVVAVVNGEEVGREAFARSYDQAASIALQQGFDPTTDEAVQAEVTTQALDVVVNTVLMIQEAEKAGVTVSEEDIDAEVAKLEEQFGGADQLATALAGVGLDTAGMRDDIREQLMVDSFITSSPEWVAISVTDEEVRAYYDEVAAQTEGLPAFEDVVDQVRAQLEYEKQQEATGALIDRVRASSTIDMKV